MPTRPSTTCSASRTVVRLADRPEQQLRRRVRRDDVGRDAAFDQPDRVMRAAEQRIVRQRHAANHHQRIEQLVDRRLAELGKRRVRRAPVGVQPHAQEAARRRAETVVGRLAVDQKANAVRRLLVGDAGAVAAPLLADDEQQRDSRLAGTRAADSAAATCAARMPFASHAPRPNSRPRSSRLGKNGGTQSKCVEKTTRGGGSSRA